jgi:hypothetical protein
MPRGGFGGPGAHAGGGSGERGRDRRRDQRFQRSGQDSDLRAGAALDGGRRGRAVVRSLLGVAASAGLLYGVGESDPGVALITAGLLTATTAAAAWGPGLRAARLDPMVTLREE